ncbi:isochorismate synthase [Waterburya agarophytonicola K14]|uniref:isochorismate synthase n=1 Tax=Waterburya agarophytonicola KI4 TaxID=2874699 RepID=A0A964BRR4_9CYAN|nr:isochorismate synthase [Waterburya agarophytonicola]MCC0178488.1 isochorismate synthase [Waterburya agarophytonicola KI4]
MSFATQSNNLILDDHNDTEFENFWHDLDSEYAVTKDTKIVSFAYQIPRVDLLACLQKFSHRDTLHFYWENCSKQEAVAAWGVTKKDYTEHNSRFSLAQEFVRECFGQIIRKGDSNLAIGKPSVFCSFTFFNDSELSQPFRSGTLFLPRFQIVKKNKNCCLIINFPLSKKQNESRVVKEIKQKLNNINWESLKQLNTNQENSLLSIGREQHQDSDYFKSVVRSALDEIAIDKLSKIVIAHTTEIKSSQPFQTIESLSNLRQLHPDCYIFSTSNGEGQYFIGASPERLISVQNRQLVTDALAGSAPRGTNNTEDLHLANLLLRNRKEKREHKAVSDFMMQRLRSIGLKPQQLPLQLLKLSNIQHLWTPIYAHLPADIEPLEIVDLLHPTPAVAGVSTEIACEKIRHYEKFDRSLYAAPLGWVDYEGNGEFIVGIRSALIDGDRARLYAGAGIVSGSNPHKEFDEIQLKLQSLLKALV